MKANLQIILPLGFSASLLAAEPIVTGQEVYATFADAKTTANQSIGKSALPAAADWSDGRPNATTGRVSRTFARMARSTAARPETVRILFYGQSIVEQDWGRKYILPKLKARYPSVNFVAENRALGGYESPILIHTAEADLYPHYPDLLFFHVYGPTDEYAEIVRRMRVRTTAEIILWTSHLNAGEGATLEKTAALLKNPDERSRAIRDTAERYGCMFVDLRAKWCRMLLARGEMSKAYLFDGVHLNDSGQRTYAEMLAEDLPQTAIETPNAWAGKVTSTPAALRLAFAGNRVTAVADGTSATAYDLFLDGRPVASFGEMWTYTRTSPGVGGTAWPMLSEVLRRTPSCEEETWTLTFDEGISANGAIIPYHLTGSITGSDGASWNTNNFVSTSGKVEIPRYVWPNFTGRWGRWKILNRQPKPGLTVTWRNVPLFTSPWKTAGKQKETTLVQNCENGPHVLELRPRQPGAALGFSHFNIHQPVRP